MKTKFNISLCTLVLTVLMSCSAGRHASAQYDANDRDGYYAPDDNNNDDYGSSSNVSMDVFVNQLSPYGRWVSSPAYGQVWICNEAGFTPYYTRGHWMYTTYGWTWASDYNWGWAPFHYGRWAYDPFYGWMWVPGYQWGPAWVGWRTGGDYYGWAPLAPGININVGFSFGNYMPAERWCFVPRRYIANPSFPKYVVERSRNITIINNTTIIKNTNVYHNNRYVVGPSRTEVERASGNRVQTVRITNDTRPGNYRMANNNRTIQMYRPQVRKDDQLTPERVERDRAVQSSPTRDIRQQPVIINNDRHDNAPAPSNNGTRRPHITNDIQSNSIPNVQHGNDQNDKPIIRNTPVPSSQDRIDNRRFDDRNSNTNRQKQDEVVFNDRPNYGIEKNSTPDNNNNTRRPSPGNNQTQSRPQVSRQQSMQRTPQFRSQPPVNSQHPQQQKDNSTRRRG